MRRWRARHADAQPLPELVAVTEDDRRYLAALHDDSRPLPDGAEDRLRSDHPRLLELREAYATLAVPALAPSRWTPERVEAFLDLRWFRGETLITWHYRELPRISALKYFVLLTHIASKDELGLLDRLGEDGLFGCWTFSYPGRPLVSRDLLDSVAELSFLERQLRLSGRDSFRVLDIGAGYGRLAHRGVTAFPGCVEWCCVDAVPESTFLAEYYLGYREVAPPARVVRLHELAALGERRFDLAVNVHSFSEMPLSAIAWWLELLGRLGVPRLFVVPNDGDRLLSLEPDGSRQDFLPAIAAAGYEPQVSEPVVDDPAVAELVGVHDRFWLFARP